MTHEHAVCAQVARLLDNVLGPAEQRTNEVDYLLVSEAIDRALHSGRF